LETPIWAGAAACLLEAKELADGASRYLVLATALLSSCPSEFLSLNAPVVALHALLRDTLAMWGCGLGCRHSSANKYRERGKMLLCRA
jgi:hypothetical protein